MATYSEMYSKGQLALKTVCVGGGAEENKNKNEEEEEEEDNPDYSSSLDDDYAAWEDDWQNDRGNDVYSDDDDLDSDLNSDDAQKKSEGDDYDECGRGNVDTLNCSDADDSNGAFYKESDLKFFVSRNETVEVDYSCGSVDPDSAVSSERSLHYGANITSYCDVTANAPAGDSSKSNLFFNFSGLYINGAQASSSSGSRGGVTLDRSYVCHEVDIVKMVLEMLSGCSNDLFFRVKMAADDSSSKNSGLNGDMFMINYVSSCINTTTIRAGSLRGILKYFLSLGNDVLFCRNFYSNFTDKFQLPSVLWDGKRARGGARGVQGDPFMIRKIMEKISYNIFEMVEIFDIQVRKIETEILCQGAQEGRYTHLFAGLASDLSEEEGGRRALRRGAGGGARRKLIKYHKTLLSLLVQFRGYEGLFRNLFCVCSTLGNILDSMSSDATSSSNSNEYLLVFLLQEVYKLSYFFSLTSLPLKCLSQGRASTSATNGGGEAGRAMAMRLPPLRNHTSIVDIFAHYLFENVFSCYIENFVKINVDSSSSSTSYGEDSAVTTSSSAPASRHSSSILPLFCTSLAKVVKDCFIDLRVIQKFTNMINFDNSQESSNMTRRMINEKVRLIISDFFSTRNSVYGRPSFEGQLLEVLFSDHQCYSDMLHAERGCGLAYIYGDEAVGSGSGDMYNDVCGFLSEKLVENCDKFEIGAAAATDLFDSSRNRNKVLKLRLKSQLGCADGAAPGEPATLKSSIIVPFINGLGLPEDAGESDSGDLLVLPLVLQLNIRVFKPLTAIIECNAQSAVYFIEKSFQLSSNFTFLQEIFFLGQNTNSKYDLYESLRSYIIATDDDYDVHAHASRGDANSSSRSAVYNNNIKINVSKRSRLLLLLEMLSAQLHAHKPYDGVSHIAISSDKDALHGVAAAPVAAPTAPLVGTSSGALINSTVISTMEMGLSDVDIDCNNSILNIIKTIQVEVIYSYPLSEIFTNGTIARYNYNMKILLYISVTKWKSENVWKVVMLSKMLMMTSDLADSSRLLVDTVKCLKGGLQVLLHSMNCIYNFYSKQIHSGIIGVFNQQIAVIVDKANVNQAVKFNTSDITLLHSIMLDSVDYIFAGIYGHLCTLCVYGYNSAELLRQCVSTYDEYGYADDTVALMTRTHQSFLSFKKHVTALSRQIKKIVGESSREGGGGGGYERMKCLVELSTALSEA